MEERRVQVVELRGASGLGVFLRVDDDRRLIRVAPVRDPNQPRFWCLAAFECSSCGIPLSGSAIWAGWWGSSPGDLPALLETIKEDAAGWLQHEQCVGLRKLLMQPRPPVTIPITRQEERAARRQSGEMERLVERAERAS